MSLPAGSVSGETEYPSLSSMCLANQNSDRRHYLLFKHFYVSSEIRGDPITHLKCCFHRVPVSWALRAYLPRCIVMLQLVATHQYEPLWLLRCVLCCAWMGYPTQLGHPVCPPASSSYGFELTEGQSLKVAFSPSGFATMKHPQKLVSGKILPSSHLIAYSLFTGMLFSQKVST